MNNAINQKEKIRKFTDFGCVERRAYISFDDL